MEETQKMESLQTLVKTLGTENEGLYHQLNHLMIRNNTLLKRIDDLQQVINELHLRLEESNRINNNLLQSNDRRKPGMDNAHAPVSLLHGQPEESANGIDMELLFQRWKSFPGQEAKNAPNLRKQAAMLASLYQQGRLKASDLFRMTDTGAVTGARYVASLKKSGMIEYSGARKKGQYHITEKGRAFIESGAIETETEANTLLVGIPMDEGIGLPAANHFDHYDL